MPAPLQPGPRGAGAQGRGVQTVGWRRVGVGVWGDAPLVSPVLPTDPLGAGAQFFCTGLFHIVGQKAGEWRGWGAWRASPQVSCDIHAAQTRPPSCRQREAPPPPPGPVELETLMGFQARPLC